MRFWNHSILEAAQWYFIRFIPCYVSVANIATTYLKYSKKSYFEPILDSQSLTSFTYAEIWSEAVSVDNLAASSKTTHNTETELLYEIEFQTYVTSDWIRTTRMELTKHNKSKYKMHLRQCEFNLRLRNDINSLFIYSTFYLIVEFNLNAKVNTITLAVSSLQTIQIPRKLNYYYLHHLRSNVLTFNLSSPIETNSLTPNIFHLCWFYRLFSFFILNCRFRTRGIRNNTTVSSGFIKCPMPSNAILRSWN